MLFSLALIFLCGLLLGSIFKRFNLPSLLGMLLTGIILGPYALDLFTPTLLDFSAALRQIALIVILTRAGLALHFDELKKVGRPAILMCFVPACLEILGVIIIAPILLNIFILDAAIMGTVLAAVSPAVIVPRMLKLIKKGYGTNKAIPQLIMAGASVDDVFVIVLFTALLGLTQGQEITAMSFLRIPVSIISGIAVGILIGIILSVFFTEFRVRDTGKILILLSISFLLVTLEQSVEGLVPFSGLLSIMALSATLYRKKTKVSVRLERKFSKLWVASEVLLFVLVGATVDISYALSSGIIVSGVILFGLVLRILGVYLSMVKTNLNKKERLFCMFAYSPKATVQAAIGSIPLSMGLASGNVILTGAVLSIIITAPMGALAIDLSYKKLLSKTNEKIL
ncbi:MAG: sodium:proton antiporter [Clostridium sp.]|nr:sodium:proton antiporter [Clostridium sp.]